MATKQDLKAKALRELEEEQKKLLEQKKKAAEEAKRAAEQAKANKEADLIGAKDAAKLNKNTSVDSAANKAKNSALVKSGSSSAVKQTASDRTARAAGGQSGIDKIEAAKREKAAAQARENKEKDLPGFDGYAYQRAKQQQIEKEKTEYLNTKEARDKKSALEKELAGLRNRAKEESKKAGTVAIVASGMKGGAGSVVSAETESEIDRLEKEIIDLDKNINLAERAQGKKYLADRATKAEDFESYSHDPEIEEPEKRYNIYKSPAQKRETETVKGYMNEEERKIYNYYYNKFGEERAEEYFESIRGDLNMREAVAIFMGNEGKTANQYLMGAAAGLDQAKSGYQSAMRMLFGDEKTDPTSVYQYLSGMAREDLADKGPKLPEALGGASLGQIGFDAVNTGANMLPSLMLGTLGGGAIGAAAIGTSAAGNAYSEALSAGYGKEQATNYAALVGASEAVLGYLLGGIEAQGGKLSKAALSKVLPKIDGALAKASVALPAKMLSEFSEEYLQEVLSSVFENIAFEEENKIDLLSPEAIYSGIMGALTAGASAVADGSTFGGNIAADIPVPFDGKAQPGTEAGLVAEKIAEIENSSLTESEKAEKMAKIAEAVAETTASEDVIAEVEKFRNLHRQKELDRATEVANRLGNVVEFDEKISANGIHKDDGTIIINPNSKNPVMQILIHELTHDIETSGLYEGFSKKILDYAAEVRGINLAKMEQEVINDYAKAGQKLDRNLADREIVAKFAEEYLFTDEKAIDRLCDTDPTVFRRIKYWIEDMIAKLRGTPEERFFIEAQRLYEKALASRGEITGAGTEQFLIQKEFENEISEWLNNTTPNQRVTSPGYFEIGTTSDVLKSIGVHDGKVYWRKYKIGAILQDHPEMSEETIKKVPQILEEPYIVMKSATREDSIVLFGELKAENGNNVMAALLLTPQASGNKIEADFSLLTTAHGDKTDDRVANLIERSEILYLDTNKNRAETWLMQLGVQFPSRQPANSSIGNISYQDGKVNIKGEKLSEIGKNVNATLEQHSTGRGFDELAADSEGNKLSPEQKEYFKDSKIRDEDGNLLIVYHGTEEDFTVFDRTKGRANMDIQGLFFSPYKEEAADYGGKVGAYYLDIKNPADSTTAYKAFEMFKGQNEAGVKAREYLEKLGYDGVINDDEEFIAFYPEQIKRIDNLNPSENPDTRYSTGRGFDELAEEAKAEHGVSEEISAEITDSAKRVIEQMKEKPSVQKSVHEFEQREAEIEPVEVPQSKKSERIERRYQKAVEDGVASVFGIDRRDIKNDIRPLLNEIAADVKDGKTITDEQIDALYKKAFDDGYISKEFPQYQQLRKFVREKPFYVSQETRHEFGDDEAFREFARENFGNFKVSTDPRNRSLDDFYKTMTEMAPEFFTEGETDPRTQLEDISDFMNQTKKQYYGLSEVYSGTNLADFESWAKKELKAYMDEFGKGLDNVRRYEKDRQIKATNKAREMDATASFEQAKAAFSGNRVFEAQKAVEKAKANTLLNDMDNLTVKKLLEGTISEADVMALGGNVEGILEDYNAEKAYRAARAPFDKYKAAYKTALQHDAIELTALSDEFTDKKIGAAYSRETAERNVKDIAGKSAGKIIEEYFTPVHENEAMKTRWIKDLNQRVADLELGKMNRWERAYAQMIGENAAYIAEGRMTKHDQNEHDVLNERISALLDKHGKKIDKAKCEKAAAGLMEIYEDILEEWNDERIRRGQEPLGKIENYFPHFTETKPETLLQKIFSKFGFDINSSKLPTDIAGRTADRKPQSKYNPHAQRRTTDVTDYDIFKGFDGYVRAVGDNIFHTEDIQKLRTLSDTIRTKYSSAEIEKRIEEIRNRDDLSEADKETLIADTFKSDPGAYHLSNFVVWLDEYTNILAGKKSRGDREAEYQMGREIYDISKALEGRIASNMIGYNLSTPVMNFVPMFQATADIAPQDILSAFLQTGVAAAKGDSFISDNSDFLTNRFGADSVYKKNYGLFTSENMKDFVAKVSDGGGLLMEFVDRIVSESLVRARYEQNIQKGMDKVSAFSEADSWAAGLIADRSLGALPTVFNIKNPVAKAVTMFQVEANNQYSYILKDAGKYKWKTEGALNTITGQLAFWAAMAICNGLADELLGRDNVVPDPIGMTAEAIEKISNGEPVGNVALDTAINAVEQIPFVGGLLGGGRVPISTALPDLEQSIKLFNKEVAPEKKGQILFDEILKPLSYIFLPSGAGQLWKTGQSIANIAQGGAYGMETDGERYMKFAQKYDPESIVKNLLFGPYAAYAGQNYIDSGFKDKLSAEQTKQMEIAHKEYGMPKDVFYETVLGLKPYKKEAEKQEALFNNSDITASQKDIIDYLLFGKPTTKAIENDVVAPERVYTSEEGFYRSGLSDADKRLFDAGYSKNEITAIDKGYDRGRNKGEKIDNIQNALGCSKAEAFEIYSRKTGDWNDELPKEEIERAKKAAEFYGMSTEKYLTVLNLSKFGAQTKDGYSTKAEDVIPNIAEVLGISKAQAEEYYNQVITFEYSKEDLSEENAKNLETAGDWYDVDEKGYFTARNVCKDISGKEAQIKEIAKQLKIDEQEATIYYLAAKGDLALSKEDLSEAKKIDITEAVKHGWTEKQFLDAVNILKITGASKKDEIIQALLNAGASYEMALGYYNLSKNYDYYKRG